MLPKLLPHFSRAMFWIIVLLIYKARIKDALCTEASHSRACYVYFLIHFADPMKGIYSLCRESTLHYDRTSSVFHCRKLILGIEALAFRTNVIPTVPNNKNLFSSLQTTEDHCWGVQLRWAIAHSTRTFRFLAEINDFFTGRRPCSPTTCRR